AAIVAALTGVDIVKVPYKGAQPVYQDLLAGRLDLFFDNTTTTQPYVDSGQVTASAFTCPESTTQPYVDSGQVKALAVSSRARDTGDWDKLRATAHPGAAMTTTWFDGRFEDFVESCQASFGKGSRSQHFLGGTIAEIKGARAIAQTRMSINVRSRLDGLEVDAV